MRKFLIGMIAACILAVSAVSASAAVSKKAVVKTKDFIAKTGKSLGNAIWDNKGSIAVGTTAVAVATNPAPFVEGAATVITGKSSNLSAGSVQSYMVGWLFYAIATLLAIVGVRCAWNYVKDYKNWLPLILGVMVCGLTGGIAEAGVLDCTAIRPPFWWSDVVGWILLVIMIFL